ncbi:hypothetical protein ACGFLT_04710 [Micromonospora chalcea]|uniref:hypothetical protein n=1 Tax=Micromonospora sp. B006 TaxID=2201999 RepID=UPI000E3369AB|nr:hypothetical protein [Micromonospora sp. B006]AXO33252.1 hypothetical protein MicB006_0949 [Micromonospora sp. B006]
MNRKLNLAAAGVLASFAAAALLVPPPAQAAGDTSRHKGCAAHWRKTATWSECQNSPGVELQFQAICNNSGDFKGLWRKVTGSLDPVDRFECRWSAVEAYNVYKS